VINDGGYDVLDFNELVCQLNYRQKRIILQDFTMHSETGDASLAGIITLAGEPGRKFTPTVNDSLGLSGQISNFELGALSKYIRIGKAVTGRTTGSVSINGKLNNPYIIYQFEVQEPVFDRIAAEIVTGKMVYENQKIVFSGLNMITRNGDYSLSGYIPLNLDFITEDRKSFKNNPMNVMITGKTNQLDFLDPYLEPVDSLTGDFTLQLSITGKQPVRSGQMVLADGKLSLLKLENSFTDINGFITIDDNILDIEYLIGRSRGQLLKQDVWAWFKKLGGKLFAQENDEEVSPNIYITGSIDMSSFFRPKYDLTLTGQDVYFASSEKRFMGSGTPELQITGKDTVLISGEFIPTPYEFIITDEFDVEGTPNIKRPGNRQL